jgi:hypothetical protein
MSEAKTSTTAAFLGTISAELNQAFSVRPDYGTVGFVCHFHDGAVVRVEVMHSTLRKVSGQANLSDK